MTTPVGALLCVLAGLTGGRPWPATAARGTLPSRRVRRRPPPLRSAPAPPRACRRDGSRGRTTGRHPAATWARNLGITSIYLEGSTAARSSTQCTTARRRCYRRALDSDDGPRDRGADEGVRTHAESRSGTTPCRRYAAGFSASRSSSAISSVGFSPRAAGRRCSRRASSPSMLTTIRTFALGSPVMHLNEARVDCRQVRVEIARLRIEICPGRRGRQPSRRCSRSISVDSHPVMACQAVGSTVCSITSVRQRPPFVRPISNRQHRIGHDPGVANPADRALSS